MCVPFSPLLPGIARDGASAGATVGGGERTWCRPSWGIADDPLDWISLYPCWEGGPAWEASRARTSPAERKWQDNESIGRFEERWSIIQRLWSGESVTFQGCYYRLENAKLNVTPVQQPIPRHWYSAIKADSFAIRGQAAQPIISLPHISAKSKSLNRHWSQTPLGPGKEVFW